MSEFPLLPCPFCGSKARMKLNHGDWGYTSDTYNVECSNGACFSRTPTHVAERWEQGKGTSRIDIEAQSRAAAQWNTRAHG